MGGLAARARPRRASRRIAVGHEWGENNELKCVWHTCAQGCCLASVLQLAQNFSRVVYVRDSQGLAFRGGARVVPPAVPDELRVTVADRADHELVAALQYVGDALYGVRLHDGA